MDIAANSEASNTTNSNSHLLQTPNVTFHSHGNTGCAPSVSFVVNNTVPRGIDAANLDIAASIEPGQRHENTSLCTNSYHGTPGSTTAAPSTVSSTSTSAQHLSKSLYTPTSDQQNLNALDPNIAITPSSSNQITLESSRTVPGTKSS